MYSLFAWLWAMSLIWHYMRPYHLYPVGWADLPVIIGSILVLVRPHNCYFLLATAVSMVVVYLTTLPLPSNHWMMAFLVNTALCSSFFWLAGRRKSLSVNADDWLTEFRPLVCALVILLYLLASLHKLNAGYFFSDHSFALRLYRDILNGLHVSEIAHLLPQDEGFLAVLPHISVVVELAIPVLLIFRRTRAIAILIGFSFHSFLSLKEYPPGTDFPTLLGAAYVLFLPNASFDIINVSIFGRMRSSRFYSPFKRLVVPTILLAVIFLPYTFSYVETSSVDWFTFSNLKSAHWAVYVISYFAVLGALIYKLRATADHHLRGGAICANSTCGHSLASLLRRLVTLSRTAYRRQLYDVQQC